MRSWWLAIALLVGCRQIFGLDDVQLDATFDAAIDQPSRHTIAVTPRGGATTIHDLDASPLVLDYQTSCDASTFTLVPQLAVTVTAKIWGAGGGGGGTLGNNGLFFGGGGGYATATIDLVAGSTYIALAGSGGLTGAQADPQACGGGGVIGGGAVNAGAGLAGSGGGFGGVFDGGAIDQARALLIAGGGGGGAGDPNNGGGGGGLVGGVGADIGGDATRNGRGGTQTAGGATGAAQTATPGNAGAELAGGASAFRSDAGGGAGYFGGGSGGSSNGGAGGGGSAFCAAVVRDCSFADAPVVDSAGTPANANDTDRGTAAVGHKDAMRAGPARIVVSAR